MNNNHRSFTNSLTAGRKAQCRVSVILLLLRRYTFRCDYSQQVFSPILLQATLKRLKSTRVSEQPLAQKNKNKKLREEKERYTCIIKM